MCMCMCMCVYVCGEKGVGRVEGRRRGGARGSTTRKQEPHTKDVGIKIGICCFCSLVLAVTHNPMLLMIIRMFMFSYYIDK